MLLSKVQEIKESNNPNTVKTKNWRILLLSKCTVFDGTKLNFVKEQETSGLLSSIGIKTYY